MRPPGTDKLVKEWLVARHRISHLTLQGNYAEWRGGRKRLDDDLSRVQHFNGGVGRESLGYALRVYALHGHGRRARAVFKLIQNPGTAEYELLLHSVVMGGLTMAGGDVDEVHQIFKDMEEAGVSPSTGCFRLLVRHLGRTERLSDGGEQVMSLMKAHRATPDVQFMNELLNYQPNMPAATALLETFQTNHSLGPNSSTLCALLRVCRRSKDTAAARRLITSHKTMPEQSPAVWNAYLHVLLDSRLHHPLVKAFHAHPAPDHHTYAILVQSCAQAMDEQLAEEAFTKMVHKGYLKSKNAIGSLMSVYAATGNAKKAEMLMDWSAKKGIPPSDAMLGYYNTAVRGSGGQTVE